MSDTSSSTYEEPSKGYCTETRVVKRRYRFERQPPLPRTKPPVHTHVCMICRQKMFNYVPCTTNLNHETLV